MGTILKSDSEKLAAVRGDLVSAVTLLQELYDSALKLDGDGTAYIIPLDAGEFEVLENALDTLAPEIGSAEPQGDDA